MALLQPGNQRLNIGTSPHSAATNPNRLRETPARYTGIPITSRDGENGGDVLSPVTDYIF